MRVLVLTSFYPPHHLGGYEVACESAVRGLRERGHEVRVLTSSFRNPGVSGGDDAVRELHLFWEAGEWRRPGLVGAVGATRQDLGVLERAVAEHRPDLVWCWQMSALSKSLLSRCAAIGVPIALAVHDLWPLYDLRPDPWLRWVRGWRAPVGWLLSGIARLPRDPPDLRRAAASYNSAWTRERVVRAGITAEGPVIPPGVDLERFAPTPPAPGPVRRFLHVGRIEPRKGPTVAVEALAHLGDAGIADATLTLVGPSERGHAREVEAAARRLGLGGRVVVEGAIRREDMPAAYARHDAVIHSATWEEPFGLTIVEAMACGRPVIVSPTGGAKEIVTESNALTFPPGDAEACAKRMWQLASDPALASRLAEEGLRTAARYSEREVNGADEEHLRSVVERS
ncbi:MAG: glycosyltransferase family 4 protein [Actinomycetota bacterium]